MLVDDPLHAFSQIRPQHNIGETDPGICDVEQLGQIAAGARELDGALALLTPCSRHKLLHRLSELPTTGLFGLYGDLFGNRKEASSVPSHMALNHAQKLSRGRHHASLSLLRTTHHGVEL
jgi:hypothetical protein